MEKPTKKVSEIGAAALFKTAAERVIAQAEAVGYAEVFAGAVAVVNISVFIMPDGRTCPAVATVAPETNDLLEMSAFTEVLGIAAGIAECVAVKCVEEAATTVEEVQDARSAFVRGHRKMEVPPWPNERRTRHVPTSGDA